MRENLEIIVAIVGLVWTAGGAIGLYLGLRIRADLADFRSELLKEFVRREDCRERHNALETVLERLS